MSRSRRFVFRIPPVTEPVGGVNFLIDLAGMIARSHASVVVLNNRPEDGLIRAPDPRVQVHFERCALQDGDVVISTDAHMPADVIALGEHRGRLTNVVAVQNHYYFARFLPHARSALRIDRMISTSSSISAFLAAHFPGIPVSEVPCYVPALQPAPKENIITFMSRKRRAEARLITSFFRYRFPQYAHWHLCDIHNVSHAEALAQLARARIFISLQYFEGFGLPALEAMAAGCAVVGFTGGGGQEYATEHNGIWAEEPNWERIPNDVAALIADAEAGGTRIARLAERGRETARRYGIEATQQAMAQFAANAATGA